jgi:hypothetical protein
MSQIPPKFFDLKIKILLICGLIIFALFAQFHVANILDARLFYSHQEALEYFQNLSFENSLLYWKAETTDFFFILTYTAFLYISLKRLLWKNPKLKYLAFLPGLFDLPETAMIWSVLTFGISPNQFSWLGLFTLMKWLSLLPILTVFIIYRRRQN